METAVRTMETEVVEMLRQSGINSEPITVTKNGIRCMGIRVVDPEHPSISPIVYYSPEETVEAIVEKVRMLQDAGTPDISIDQITDPAYVAANVYMTIQRISDDGEDVLKQDCLNLELVLRIPLQLGISKGSVKVNKAFLERTGIAENAIWQMARDNMRETFVIDSMAATLGLPEEFAPDIPFYVCSTDDRMNGATALAFPEIFRNFCMHVEAAGCWIIPSSTEEVLLIPYGAIDVDPECLASMVEEINGNVVDPLLQLDPCAYAYDMDKDMVQIAATRAMRGEIL